MGCLILVDLAKMMHEQQETMDACLGLTYDDKPNQLKQNATGICVTTG